MSQTHDMPFGIMDVAELLHIRIRRPSGRGYYADCPFCGDKRGKLHLNTEFDGWKCNYCGEHGGILDLYGKLNKVGRSEAYREICDALQNGIVSYGTLYKKFEEYFLGRGQLDFQMDGVPYSILITEAECFPQAYAAAMPVFQKLQQLPKAIIVDIGGFTAFLMKYIHTIYL